MLLWLYAELQIHILLIHMPSLDLWRYTSVDLVLTSSDSSVSEMSEFGQASKQLLHNGLIRRRKLFDGHSASTTIITEINLKTAVSKWLISVLEKNFLGCNFYF